MLGLGKKAGAVLLSCMIATVGLLSACSTKDEGTSDKGAQQTAASKPSPVTLKVMFPGDPPGNWNEVKDEMEKRMADTLNVKLNVVFIPWADVAQKRQVALTSAEEYDLIWDNRPSQNIVAGFYEPLDALIDKHGPDIKSTRSQELFQANKVNGKIYAVPLEVSFIRPWGFVIRKDLREKLGFAPIKSWEELVKFMYAVKEKEQGITPYIPNNDEHTPVKLASMLNLKSNFNRAGNSASYDYLYTTGNDGKVHNIFDEMDPGLLKVIEQNRKMYLDGVLAKDTMILSNAEFAKGKAAVTTFNDFGVSLSVKTNLEKAVPGASAEFFTLFDPGSKMSSTFLAGNFIAVPTVSKNKERAIQFLNWLNQKENYDLLAYGIKGKNWEDAGEGLYKPIKETPYAGIPFAWGWNPKLERIDATLPEEIIKLIKWSRDPNNFTADILAGFTFDQTPVANELAQLASISKEMFVPVKLGVLDTNEGLAKFKEKAYPLVKKVQTEYQKQIDKHLADKKK